MKSYAHFNLLTIKTAVEAVCIWVRVYAAMRSSCVVRMLTGEAARLWYSARLWAWQQDGVRGLPHSTANYQGSHLTYLWITRVLHMIEKIDRIIL